jgi:abortive infection bacteriophage resistance protein
MSVADQVTLLESRGLIIDDRPLAEAFLGYANYYRFSGYCLAFKDRSDHFRGGVKFGDIVYAYQFDSDLRSLVGDWLELAEIDLRTQSVHLFSEKYNAFGHCNPANFANPFSIKITHAEWLARLQEDTKNSEKERCVSHFKDRYLEYPNLPIWAAAEVMTFGLLSRFISGMKRKDRKALAKFYNLNSDELASMVHHLSYVRNVCAHHGRLWERYHQIKLLLPATPEWQGSNKIDNARLFCTLVFLRILTRRTPHILDAANRCHQKINDLLERPPQVPNPSSRLGLPANWQQHPLWV